MLSNNSVFLRRSHPRYYLVLPQTLESGVFFYPLTGEETEMLTRKQRLHPSGNSVRVFYYRPISLLTGYLRNVICALMRQVRVRIKLANACDVPSMIHTIRVNDKGTICCYSHHSHLKIHK